MFIFKRKLTIQVGTVFLLQILIDGLDKKNICINEFGKQIISVFYGEKYHKYVHCHTYNKFHYISTYHHGYLGT